MYIIYYCGTNISIMECTFIQIYEYCLTECLISDALLSNREHHTQTNFGTKWQHSDLTSKVKEQRIVSTRALNFRESTNMVLVVGHSHDAEQIPTRDKCRNVFFFLELSKVLSYDCFCNVWEENFLLENKPMLSRLN